MERPNKMRILDPDIRSPRDSTSQMAEGLFTSELGIQGDDTDGHHAIPTRTINLSDFQRRTIGGQNAGRRPSLPRRNAGIYLLPRAPDATVTASVVEIQVNDGTTTSVATTLPAVTQATVVSVEDVGSVTVPGATSATGVVGTAHSDSQTIITTPPPTPLPSDTFTTSSTGPSHTGSLLSDTLNSTGTNSAERTVTVTATATFEIKYINGTVIAAGLTQASTLTASTGIGLDSTSGPFTYSSGSPSGIVVSNPSSNPSSATALPGVANTAYPGSSTTSSSAAATSSDSQSSAGGGPGLSPAQQQVVGGVVGGVAGVAVVLLVILILLRWYRRRLKSRGELPEQIAARNLPGGPFGSSMSQRSSGVPLTSQLASSLRRFRPTSTHTQATTMTVSTVPESERGFQRIAGRKIAPVLAGGGSGDGYGGNYGAFEKETAAGSSHNRNERSLAGSSFYRDSGGFYGGKGPGSPTFPPSPTITSSGTKSTHVPAPSFSRDFAGSPDDEPSPNQMLLASSRPEGMAALRPSPARTPVTVSPAASSIRLPIQHNPTVGEDAPPVPQIVVPVMTDGIGRTLLREDNSRISARSRSTGTGSRFAENL